jgi:transposase
MTTILGIDLGKFKSVFCVFVPETGEVRYETLPTDTQRFREFLIKTAPTITLFETCTAAGWVYDLCQELGRKCAVANPLGEAWQWRKVKRKTDRDDAFKLVNMYQLGQLPTVHMPPRETREYRAMIAFRQRLIERRTMICNHIRALFQAQGLHLPAGKEAWTKAARAAWTKGWARPLDGCGLGELWRGELAVEFEQLDALEEQIAQVDKKLDALGKANASVELLKTIPGVGTRTAEAVVAYLGDPKRFKNSREVSCYAGLVPRQFQSGTMDRKGRITKRGPCYLRKILVQCAWLMRRHNAWGAQLVERISRGQKGRRKSAVVALSRKLLVRCWAMLRKGEPWKQPDLVPTAS